MTVQHDIFVEPTAHPRARKFILRDEARRGEPVAFADAAACPHVPMAQALLNLGTIQEVYFSGNVITVTAVRGAEWDELEETITTTIEDHLATHDPLMLKPDEPRKVGTAIGDLALIDGIIERTIRPYIHSHGGEVELVNYDPETHRLTVNYQGTCGHCPASTSGTLEVIQQILSDEFDPRIQIEIA
ncbi:MAG: NifU family protein [Verrucomicrobia bacterium]|nr:NifU family protein [Verrucomicrobiota bacterium]